VPETQQIIGKVDAGGYSFKQSEVINSLQYCNINNDEALYVDNDFESDLGTSRNQVKEIEKTRLKEEMVKI
jgi:hypothetical protein